LPEAVKSIDKLCNDYKEGIESVLETVNDNLPTSEEEEEIADVNATDEEKKGNY